MNNNKILFHLASSQLCIMTSGLFNVTYPWWYWHAFLLSSALTLRSFLKPSTHRISTQQMPFPIFSFQVLEAANLPKWVMNNWRETARSNSRGVTASMTLHSYKTYLQVFTTHIQRIRWDDAFSIGSCSEIQIRLSRAVPDEANLSLFMTIAKWEHSRLLSRKWLEDLWLAAKGMQDKAWAHHHWALRKPQISFVCYSWSKPWLFKEIFSFIFFKVFCIRVGSSVRQQESRALHIRRKPEMARGGNESSRIHRVASQVKNWSRAESRMWLKGPSRTNHWETSNTTMEKKDKDGSSVER